MAFASGLNLVTLAGVIVTDIVEIHNKAGETVGYRFTVGVTDEPPKDKSKPQVTNYIPCTAWGWVGKRIADKCEKKTPILIHGKWQSGSYTDRNGNKVYTHTCIVGKVLDFLNGTPSGGDMRKPETTTDPVAELLGVSDTGAGTYPEIDPDDLPF